MLHIVVPYSSQNASVRSRAVEWVNRCARGDGLTAADLATLYGPGFTSGTPPPGAPLLLVRNARKFSRGRLEQRLLRGARPGVYDLDDGLPWDDGRLPGLGRWWKRPWPRSLIARRAAAAAHRVIAGNDVIAEWAAAHCPEVVIVPTCVEPTDYAQKTGYEIAEPPVIGWIGSPATEHYLELIAAPLGELHRRTGARLELVSSAGGLPNALQPFTTRVEWSNAEAGRRPATWDVGVMPLADGVYERAKCGYKLLQYAAAGLPMVGSPVGINRRVLHDADGLAPTNTDEWFDALLALVEEPTAARAARGAAGRRVANEYSFANWESRWRAAAGLSPGGQAR